jgi:predicted small lipoprotein YifL
MRVLPLEVCAQNNPNQTCAAWISETPSVRQAARVCLVLLVGLGVLVACGKKGPPEPPGPPDKIIYPKTYPTR